MTFTHLITNDGAAIMTHLPLTDTYNPTLLQFHFAVPTPTVISPGLLVWTDLTTYFGNIPPFGSVVVTTVFTATTQVISTENSASTEGALDEYNNDLTAGSDQVPITIIDVPSTPAPAPTLDDEDDDDDTPTSAPTATPFAAFTPTPTPMATQAVTDTIQGPLYLPETGWRPINRFVVPIWGLVLLMLGWYITRQRH
jgi:hypothetical protein